MLHTQLAALALAAAAVIASGCGSSKTESSTTATTAASTTTASTTATVPTTPAKVATGVALTRTQWIADGNAICQSTEAKFRALDAHTETQLASELPLAASYYTAQAEELAKLIPPKSKAHEWEQVVDDIHLVSEYTDQAAEYIKKAHQLHGPALAKASQLQKQVVATARRNGLTRCTRIG